MKSRFVATLLAFLVAVALAGSAYGGYRTWKSAAIKDQLRPPAKLTAIYLSQLVALENGQGVTWKEYFEKADGIVAEIDKAIVQAKSTAADENEKSTKQALAFMSASQGLVRSMNMLKRKRFQLSNAIDRMDDQIKDLASSNQYTRRAALDRGDDVTAAASKALEEMKGATKDAAAQVELLKPLMPTIKEAFGTELAAALAPVEKQFQQWTDDGKKPASAPSAS